MLDNDANNGQKCKRYTHKITFNYAFGYFVFEAKHGRVFVAGTAVW